MIPLGSERRTVLAGIVGTTVGSSVLFTRSFPIPLWHGGVFAFLMVVTAMGVSHRFDAGFTDPRAVLAAFVGLVGGTTLYAITFLTVIYGYPHPELLGVWQSVGESVYDALRLFIVPALGTALVVDYLLTRYDRAFPDAQSG